MGHLSHPSPAVSICLWAVLQEGGHHQRAVCISSEEGVCRSESHCQVAKAGIWESLLFEVHSRKGEHSRRNLYLSGSSKGYQGWQAGGVCDLWVSGLCFEWLIDEWMSSESQPLVAASSHSHEWINESPKTGIQHYQVWQLHNSYHCLTIGTGLSYWVSWYSLSKFVPVSFAAGGYDSQVPPTNRQTDLLGLIPSRRQWVNSKRRKKDTVKTL